MKIAIISPTFPPYGGGIGNVAYANAKELQRLGEQVTIFTPLYQPTGEEISRLEIKRLKPALKYGNAAFLPRLNKLLKGYQIIHLHYPFFGAAEVVWLGAKKLKKQGSKIILHYHMDVVGGGLLKTIFALHTKFILPKIVKVADKVIVTSTDYAKNSNLVGLIEKNPDKFVAVPNGVDTTNFCPTPKDNELMRKHQIKPDDKVILFVGGLDKAHYFKGVEYLIEAVSRLRQSVYSWKLLIVGEGSLKKDYQDLAGQLMIDGRTIFAGYVANADLPKYYNLSDLAVLPSIDKSEAFGLVLIEAMACGKPVIASNLVGVRSVVDEDKNGLLAKPEDPNDLATKINYILSNDQLAEQFGQAGLQKAQNQYDWKKIGLQIDELYKRL